ncbi:MAG: DUF4252 domain-containing protein [Bacteroidales bacterium]|nr:DUF4252 domain-containing protein [Bacteroidales bacterium]
MKRHNNIQRIAISILLAFLCSVLSFGQEKGVKEKIDECQSKAGYNLVTLGKGRIKLMATFVKDKSAKNTLKRLDTVRMLTVPLASADGLPFIDSLREKAKETYMYLANFREENSAEYEIYLHFSRDIDSPSITPESMTELPEGTLLDEMLIIRPYAGLVMLLSGEIPFGDNAWMSLTDLQ